MREFNEQFRGVDRTTDVLSFPQIEPQSSKFKTHAIILGDIVINLHKARRQATEYNQTLNEELKRLLIHGLLHLVNYDHEKSGHHKKKMKSKEKELFTALRHL